MARALIHQATNDAIAEAVLKADGLLRAGDPLRAYDELARVLGLSGRTNEVGVAQTGHDYWTLASIGEAQLIQGDLEAASTSYLAAVAAAPGRLADVSSTRRQALRLADALGIPQPAVRAWFPIPAVVLFAGHMIDQPERPIPRFPAGAEESIKSAIRRELTEVGASFGFSSAACGADILFLDTLIELGGEASVILPCEARLSG